MGQRWSFFKESDASWGMFYPKNYLVAGYGSLERAEEVRQLLLGAGFAQDDVASASGAFVVEQLESHREPGFIERIKQEIARAVGTEVGYIEDDLKHAREGGAFLFVYVPTDDAVARARAIVDASIPVLARRYMSLGIERYTYPAQSQIRSASRRAVNRE